MAKGYDQPSIGAAYRQNEPPDDGTESAANEITWSKHVDKIATPLKDYIDAINQEIDDAIDGLFPAGITSASTNYTVQESDNGKLINASNTITVTLPAASTAGVGFLVWVRNSGNGIITVDGNGAETINGSATVDLAPGACLLLTTTGSNWSGTDSLPSNDPVVYKSDDGASAGPTVTLDRSSASPAASDVLGAIPFKGRDSGGGTDTYAQVQAEIVDPTAASEDGKLAWQTAVAGTLATRGYIAQGQVLGSPTGGDKGTGTLNVASGLYYDGTPIGFPISSASGSAAALEFTSGITSDYAEIVFVLVNVVPNSTDTLLLMEFSSDGGSNWITSGYHWTVFRMSSDGTTAITASTSAAAMFFIPNADGYRTLGTGSQGGVNGIVRVSDPTSSVYTFVNASLSNRGTTTQSRITAMGLYPQATAINAMRFRFETSAGADVNTAAGTIYMYGIRKT